MKKLTKINIKFFFLFGLVLVIAILTPHIMHGHLYVPEEYAQSIILILDLIMAFVFYLLYQKETTKLKQEKKLVENNLIDSYQYIGQINNKMRLINNFNRPLEKLNKNNLGEKELFQEYLQNIIVSLAFSDKGFIRFIEAESKRTIKEFYYHQRGDQFVAKLSNQEIIDEAQPFGTKVQVIESDYTQAKIRCVLCYSRLSEKKVDLQLMKNLINQAHLLFLALYHQAFRPVDRCNVC
jgi:hypothetical protein